MAYTKPELRTIYDRTSGNCHICHKKLSLKNYGIIGGRGAWEVEHSRPRAKGGTDHGNNLYAACISCNRKKGDHHTRTARRWNGTTKAPLSGKKKKEIRNDNTTFGGILGGLVGGAVAGPVGAAVCAGIGAALGAKNKVRKA